MGKERLSGRWQTRGFGCPEHLEDLITAREIHEERNVEWGAVRGPEVLVTRRHSWGFWVNKEKLGRSTNIREWRWEAEARGLRVGERKEREEG